MSSTDNNDYEKAIERLTIIFPKGKISEESYVTAVKKLEEKMNKNIAEGYKLCPSCKKAILKGFKVCPHCDSELTSSSSNSYTSPHIKPTSLWYIVAIFFGLIGGLIGYVAVKDEDKEMADALLAIGIIMTIIGIFVIWWSLYALSLI